MRRAFFLGAAAFFRVVVALPAAFLFAAFFAGAFFFASLFLASFFFGAAFFRFACFFLDFFRVAIRAVYHRQVIPGMAHLSAALDSDFGLEPCDRSRGTPGVATSKSSDKSVRPTRARASGSAAAYADWQRFGDYLISVQGCAWFKAYFATAFSSNSKPRPGV